MGNKITEELKKYEKMGFGANEIAEISIGLEDGVDVAAFAKPEFLAIHMRQIRLGIEEGLDVSIYAKPEFDWFQMEEIRKGLRSGVDVVKYAKPEISYDRMREVRKALEAGIDLSKYVKCQAGILRVLRKSIVSKVNIGPYITQGYDEKQLEEIRIAMEKGVDVSPYISKDLRDVAIREIVNGLISKVDVTRYAGLEYDWRQMRELRLGLENRIDISAYENPMYDWTQMQEIRLGLEDGVDVSNYKSFMYPGQEMHDKRVILQKKAEEESNFWNGNAAATDFYEYAEDVVSHEESGNFSLIVSQDGMSVFLAVNGAAHPIGKKAITNAFKEYGIVYGIDQDAVTKLGSGKYDELMLKVASGHFPKSGDDGWYEYFFSMEAAKAPRTYPEGAIDYKDLQWFAPVNKGDKIAVYHPACKGENGVTVRGEIIPAKPGKEQPILGGSGYSLDESKRVYYAEKSGIIEVVDGQIMITPLLIVDSLSTGSKNVDFEGTVYVNGTLSGEVSVKATRDVIVDGFVERATIEAGGSVFLRKGINNSGTCIVKAANDVVGAFFEKTRVEAGGSIRGNYALLSELYADDKVYINGAMGSLVSGYTCAGRGVEVLELGNKSGSYTYVKLGRGEQLYEDLHNTEERIKTVYEELAILGNAFIEFQTKYRPEVRCVRPDYIQIENAIYTKELENGELLKEKKQLEAKIAESEKAEVIVKKSLFENVCVEIGNSKVMSEVMQAVRIKRYNQEVELFALQ